MLFYVYFYPPFLTLIFLIYLISLLASLDRAPSVRQTCPL